MALADGAATARGATRPHVRIDGQNRSALREQAVLEWQQFIDDEAENGCEDLEERAFDLLEVQLDLALIHAGDLAEFVSVMSYAKCLRKALTKLNQKS